MLSPDEIWEELFIEVQTKRIFKDSKTFVDCIPKYQKHEVLHNYYAERNYPDFRLKSFILNNFNLPENNSSDFHTKSDVTIETHLKNIWKVLHRSADKKYIEGSSLIPLPYSYIVPGGRFGEVYYWDSYFTMLGLAVHDKWIIIENIIDNFASLIENVGHIPNGNRSYYKTRSQPPFFALMVALLAEHRGDLVWSKYQVNIQKEYDFWMKGAKDLDTNTITKNRTVIVDGYIVNRYWDDSDTPRPESYIEDIETAKESNRPAQEVFRHLRAGAESGWDYSCRWFSDTKNIATINTTNIVPIDLNCLMYDIECKLYKTEKAEKRKAFILSKCWNEKESFFYDFNIQSNATTNVLSLAGAYPLFFNIATPQQAKKIAERIQKDFLKDGGLITTLNTTGQQWDSPNGWAPLHWIVYKGLKNYGFDELAAEIKKRWLSLNKKVFEQTGKMMEKYNVCDIDTLGGGGEYPNQDGFGWTNGVFLKLSSEL